MLQLSIGLCHDVIYYVPEGINITASNDEIVVSGICKQKVGHVAAEIRSLKKPEPYKGKGIREKGQYVLKKEGKKK